MEKKKKTSFLIAKSIKNHVERGHVPLFYFDDFPSSTSNYLKDVHGISYTLWWTNIAIENGPFIDGLPIKNGGSFHCYVSSPEGISIINHHEIPLNHHFPMVFLWFSYGFPIFPMVFLWFLFHSLARGTLRPLAPRLHLLHLLHGAPPASETEVLSAAPARAWRPGVGWPWYRFSPVDHGFLDTMVFSLVGGATSYLPWWLIYLVNIYIYIYMVMDTKTHWLGYPLVN